MSIDPIKNSGNGDGNIRAKGSEDSRKPVAKGQLHKRSFSTTLSDIFIMQDVKSVGAFVFQRVIVPALQNLAVNTINSVARGIFLGEGSINTYNEPRRGSTGYTPYGSMYQGDNRSATVTKHKTGGRFRFEELSYADYGDAQLVLDDLDECIKASGRATIADLYEASDISCPYTGHYYGWTDLSKARIVQDGDRWWLKMPNAIEFKTLRD